MHEISKNTIIVFLDILSTVALNFMCIDEMKYAIKLLLELCSHCTWVDNTETIKIPIFPERRDIFPYACVHFRGAHFIAWPWPTKLYVVFVVTQPQKH